MHNRFEIWGMCLIMLYVAAHSFQELPSVASELVNDLDRVQKELLLNLEKIVRCVLQSGLANFGRRVG